MDWTNWKTWTIAVGILLAAFAIYTFASPDSRPEPVATATTEPPVRSAGSRTASRPAASTPGVEPVKFDLLEAESGSYRSDRNIFAFVEAPPPPPPKAPEPPPVVVPPDTDKDGIPDFRDNCPSMANADQRDIDGDGIGTACEADTEVPPPPPAPVPPRFTYKFIGMFGQASNPIATFTREGEIVNARVGDIIDKQFILRGIGIESVEIGFVGFPPDQRQRIPLGQ